MTTNDKRDEVRGYEDGKGVVRKEERFATGIDDLWSALTDPERLACWLGEFDGDLRSGGEFKARFFASGGEGAGKVDVCDPPRHLVVTTTDADCREERTIEATPTSERDGTFLLLVERGMPVDLLVAYGAGVQVHIEEPRRPHRRPKTLRCPGALEVNQSRL